MKPEPFKIVAYVGLGNISRAEAEKAAKAIFAGIWDLMPDLPEPAVSVIMFDETGPIHRIEVDDLTLAIKIRRRAK